VGGQEDGAARDRRYGRRHLEAFAQGLTVHVTRAFHPDDVSVRDGIPVTSVSRTLLDLAEVVAPTQLQRAYEEAERLELLDVRAVERLLARSNGRRGVGALRALLEYDPAPAAQTASELERRFLDLVRNEGLPTPQVNVLVEGFLVDAYWPARRMVVELDGYAFHSGARAFERDHEKLVRLRMAGYEVLPFTYCQVTESAGWVGGVLRRCLSEPAG
jgi:very-short-patch-repair endonuclease